MLIDEFLPRYHARSQIRREVLASGEATYQALLRLRLGSTRVDRLKMRLRKVPRIWLGLAGLDRVGYGLLAEREGEERLFGLVGRFWLPRGNLQALDPAEFQRFARTGFAKAAWSFSVAPTAEGADLTTELRVQCIDEWSRRQLALFWTLHAGFGANVRLAAVMAAKNLAESAGKNGTRPVGL